MRIILKVTEESAGKQIEDVVYIEPFFVSEPYIQFTTETSNEIFVIDITEFGNFAFHGKLYSAMQVEN